MRGTELGARGGERKVSPSCASIDNRTAVFTALSLRMASGVVQS